MLQHNFLHAKICRIFIFMLCTFVFVQLPLQASDNWSWKHWTALATGVAGIVVSAWYLKSYLGKSKKVFESRKALAPFNTVVVGRNIDAVISKGDEDRLVGIWSCSGASKTVDVDVKGGVLSFTQTDAATHERANATIHTKTPIKNLFVQQGGSATLSYPDQEELTVEHQGHGAQTLIHSLNTKKVTLKSLYRDC